MGVLSVKTNVTFTAAADSSSAPINVTGCVAFNNQSLTILLNSNKTSASSVVIVSTPCVSSQFAQVTVSRSGDESSTSCLSGQQYFDNKANQFSVLLGDSSSASW